ncbi:MAG: hydroxyacid dehydrogenase [Alphaproteobacteria bacterium]|nr:hydroxyacid dehydrogenase [Alphaproteobacteria bacterium]
MTDIVITEFMDEQAVAGLAADFDLVYDAGLVDRPEDLAALAAGAGALIVRNRTQVRGALLAACTKLMAVGRLGVGLDNIDVAACRARGIAVFPATGANDVAVAEYVMAGLFLLFRPAFGASAQVAAGAWPRTALMDGREIAGKRLGLIGFGATARQVARRARALGMPVLASDPHVRPDDPAWREFDVEPRALDDLLRAADAISLHIPLTDETRGLIDARRLALMKPDAVLINAARGGVVDETALAHALTAGQLAGAMLDVFEREPLPGGGVLAGVPNLILTPHIAGLTREANARVGSLVAERVRAVLERKA